MGLMNFVCLVLCLCGFATELVFSNVALILLGDCVLLITRIIVFSLAVCLYVQLSLIHI